MKHSKITLTDKQGNNCALSNLIGYTIKSASVADIADAIEDATTPLGLCKRLNVIDLSKKPWVVDRETTTYCRLKHTDVLGNIDYLIINY